MPHGNGGIDWIAIAISLTIGFFGGVVRFLNHANRFSLYKFAVQVITSGFVAVLVGLALSAHSSIPRELQLALVGVCAYGGTSIMDTVLEAIRRKIEGTNKN